MKRLSVVALAFAITAAAAAMIGAQRATPLAQGGIQPAVDVQAALRTAAPDLEQQLARFKVVRMPYNRASLTPRERQMIDQLVLACRALESMYWRQSDPDGLALYKALVNIDTPVARSVRRYLLINGSRWALIDENKPF